MKRLISIGLILILILSASAMAFGASGVTLRRTEAEKVFALVNQERKKAGKPALAWVEDLYQPALTRAKELEQEFSHTRPDGSDWNTVSDLAHGENISWNRKTAQQVMDQWMGSQGHKDNILGNTYDYKGIAIAAIDTPKGPYWVQLFTMETVGVTDISPTTKPDHSTTGSPVIPAENSPAVTTGGAQVEEKSVYTEQELLSAVNAAAKENTKIVNPVLKNPKGLTPATVKVLADWSATNGKELAISFDTPYSNGKGVQGRFNFYPTRYKTLPEQALTFWVEVEGKKLTDAKEKFSKWFSNPMAFVSIEQGGGAGLGVMDIAAKVDLSQMDTDNLVLYSYDPVKSEYRQLKDTNHRMDANGFLHFSASTTAKYIVIAEGTLQKKA